MSSRIALLIGAVIGLLTAVDLAHNLGHSNRAAPPSVVGAPQIRAQPADVAGIATDLDRANGRDDITCAMGTAQSELTCHASDGTVWAVNVLSLPDHYTATVTTRSVYWQSARFDVEVVNNAVKKCSQMGLS